MVQDVSAFRTGVVNLTGGGFPEQLQSAQVSADYFRLFGATPLPRPHLHAAGGPAAGREGRACSATASGHRRFAADPQILGKTISLGGDPHVVIGVIEPGFRFPRIRPRARCVGGLSTRSQPHGSGPLLQRRRAPEARRDAGAGEGAAEGFGRGVSGASIPTALRANQGFSVEPMREAMVSNVRSSLLVLVGAVSFRAADCVRERGQSAAGARRRAAARDRDPRGDRRGPRRASSGNCLRRACCSRWPGRWLGTVLGIVGIRALLSVNTANLPRVGRGRRAGRGGLARSGVHDSGRRCVTGILFGLIPALQTSRPDLSATLKESGGRVRHRLPPQQGAHDAGGQRSGARGGAAGGRGPADPHLAGAGRGEAGLRRRERAHHANVDRRAAVREVGGGGSDAARRRRARYAHSRSDDRERHLLRAAGRRLRAAVPRHGAAAHRRAIPWRRRLADGLARLSSKCSRSRWCAAALSPSATTAPRRRWW